MDCFLLWVGQGAGLLSAPAGGVRGQEGDKGLEQELQVFFFCKVLVNTAWAGESNRSHLMSITFCVYVKDKLSEKLNTCTYNTGYN